MPDQSTSSTIALFEEHFSDISDPRDNRGKLHDFFDILVIAILSIICGADEFTDMEEFGKSKRPFLSTFLKLKNGIPSHDTFGRLFALLPPDSFRKCFVNWVNSLCNLNGDIVNIDGKALRRSFDTSGDKSMIYRVSAWANSNNLVLGQVKVSEKSNEITAIPKLLELLNLEGSIITIDAMGTQREIAKAIVDKKADYVLALKGNQGSLQEEVIEAFDTFDALKKSTIDHQLALDHGRIEERTCYVVAAKDYLSPDILAKWKKLTTLVKVEAYTTYKNGKKQGLQQYQERYYITSLTQDAAQINHAVRTHWGIETKLHWVLDVAFREDDSRIRKGHADENMAIARHVAVNKLKNEKSCKRGIKGKRKKAGWDNEYLIKVLTV